MKKSSITFLSLLFLLAQVINLQAQRTCNHESHMNSLMQNHSYATQHQERQNKFEIVHQNNQNLDRAQCANPVTLPMAVHYQGLPSGYDEACLTALAEDQIRILNEDYGGYNADISTWVNSASQYYPGVNNGETCIAFCLATQNHPTGYGLTNGSPAVTFNTTSGDSDTNFSGYINIFVRDISFLGYSPLGGSGNGDGVVIDDNAFGSGAGCTGVVPGNPYDLGRTLTHELGHYLNLDHIWGGGCAQDDGIADTPSQDGSNGSCPVLGGTVSCNTEDLHMNYMDYTNDACMYMFSAGQSTVMENYVTANLQNVVNNYATVCNDVLPTCTDGIQNGDETGVDCGGSTCPACPPSCTDGIQNQGETGVDCGGPNCPDCPTCSDGIQNGDETGVDCGGSTCSACSAAPCSTFSGNYFNYVNSPTACGPENAMSSPFPVWTNEGYIVDSLLPNQDYNFNYCGGYDPALWTGTITVYSLIDDGSQYFLGDLVGFAEGCSIDITSTNETAYLFYINDVSDACDAGSNQVDNGIPQIYCIDTPVFTGIYVDETATGLNDGSNWVNAFTDLQDALAIGANDTIHVAKGIYLPGTTRGSSFSIPSGVTVLGGYPSGGGTRDPSSNTTTLSGNIDGNPGYSGNVFNVVKLQNVTGVILDGLDIKDGNADVESSFGRSRGGGIYSSGSSAIIKNTTLRWNRAIYGGAIFATLSPEFQLTDCTIKLNTAENGSAVYHSNQTNLIVDGCYITNNNSTVRCAIEINNSLSTLINNSVIANNASRNSNAIGFIATTRNQSCNIYSSTILGETKNTPLISLQIGNNRVLNVNIYNSIIAHQNPSFSRNVVVFNNGTLNFVTDNCYIQGSSIIGSPTGNLYEDSAGAVTYGSNYAPDNCSPTVDAGNNANVIFSALDIDGNDRIVAGNVDIGAHEAQDSCPVSRESITAADVSIFPNPTSGMVFVRTDLETFNVRVFDILGKVVAQSDTKEISLGNLPLGIYMINVESNGELVKVEKIVKK